MNLFLDRLSFFNYGIVERAKNNFPGYTNTESELKLFELRLSSSRFLKPLRSLGKVQKSFDAISSLIRWGINDNY